MQGPAIQGLMSRYLEQSASAFMDMQDAAAAADAQPLRQLPVPQLRRHAGKQPGPEAADEAAAARTRAEPSRPPRLTSAR